MNRQPASRNTSYRAVIDRRRLVVARSVLRGMTQREIVLGLEKEKLVNPKTTRAWSLGTINGDIKAVRALWQSEASRDYGEHISRALAENRELRREAWIREDFDLVLKSWDREVKLLGLNQPELFAVADWRQEVEDAGADAGEIFDRLVEAAATAFESSAESTVPGSST